MASSSVHRFGLRLRFSPLSVKLTAAVWATAMWFLSVRLNMPW